MPEEKALKPSASYLYIGIPLLLTAIVFLHTLGDSFSNWDDPGYVTSNPLIQSFSVENIQRIFSPNTFVCGNYHPLTILSLAANYAIGKLDPRGYIALNILLHLVNVLLVFLFIRKLAGSDRVASVCALLFGIHPMHVESVAWISGRKDLLYSAFYLIALLQYLRYLESRGRKKTSAYLLMSLVFVLALLSKAVAVTLPIALFLIDFYRFRTFALRMAVEKIPLIALSLACGLVAIHAQKSASAMAEPGSAEYLGRISIGAYGYLFYLVKFVAPWRLSAFYPYPSIFGDSLRFPWYLLPASFVATSGLAFLRRQKVLLFGAAFFLIQVLLTLQFVAVGSAIAADRYSYLAYIGLSFIAAWYVDKALSLPRLRIFIIVTGIAAVLVLSIAAFQRTLVWQNSFTLWSDAVSVQPEAGVAHNHLGTAFLESGNVDEAIACYRRAISVSPGLADARYNLGRALFMIGRNDEAIPALEKAILLRPDFSNAHNNLGSVLSRAGRTGEAIVEYQRAIELDSTNVEALLNLGQLYLAIQMPDKAVPCFSRVAAMNPLRIDAWSFLFNTHLMMGNIDKAIDAAGRAIAAARKTGNAGVIRDIEDNCREMHLDVTRLEQAAGE